MQSAESRRELDEPLRAILAFAEKLALLPAEMSAADVMTLRGHGLSDEAILHVVQIVAYFSFVNRLADGLGVKLETPG